jgi:hypothetical protein
LYGREVWNLNQFNHELGDLKKKLKEFYKSIKDGARMQILSEAQAVELKRELEDLKR